MFTPETNSGLDAVLPPEATRANPLDVHGDAPPQRIADAVALALADAHTDAVLVLHVPLPAAASTDSARAVANAARGASKPVLAAWLGSIERTEARQALEAGGVANYTRKMQSRRSHFSRRTGATSNGCRHTCSRAEPLDLAAASESVPALSCRTGVLNDLEAARPVGIRAADTGYRRSMAQPGRARRIVCCGLNPTQTRTGGALI